MLPPADAACIVHFNTPPTSGKMEPNGFGSHIGDNMVGLAFAAVLH
jgi:hypothetical protein